MTEPAHRPSASCAADIGPALAPRLLRPCIRSALREELAGWRRRGPAVVNAAATSDAAHAGVGADAGDDVGADAGVDVQARGDGVDGGLRRVRGHDARVLQRPHADVVP